MTWKPVRVKKEALERDWFESGGDLEDLREAVFKEKHAKRIAKAERRVVRAAEKWDHHDQDHLRDCPCKRCIELGVAVSALNRARKVKK